jgi:hypothetical protein
VVHGRDAERGAETVQEITAAGGKAKCPPGTLRTMSQSAHVLQTSPASANWVSSSPVSPRARSWDGVRDRLAEKVQRYELISSGPDAPDAVFLKPDTC